MEKTLKELYRDVIRIKVEIRELDRERQKVEMDLIKGGLVEKRHMGCCTLTGQN